MPRSRTRPSAEDVIALEDQATERFPGTGIIDFRWHRREREEYDELRRDWNSMRPQLMRDLVAGNEAALRRSGFDDIDIENMHNGYVPENWEVHHIHPLDDSGENRPDNLVLIQREDHSAVHAFLNPQLRGLKTGASRTIRFLDIQPGVYPPVPGLVLPQTGLAADETRPAAPEVDSPSHRPAARIAP